MLAAADSLSGEGRLPGGGGGGGVGGGGGGGGGGHAGVDGAHDLRGRPGGAWRMDRCCICPGVRVPRSDDLA